MSLTISLSPNGESLVATSEHGLDIPLARGEAEAQLIAMLARQRERKTLATNRLTGEAMAIVLANWGREGPHGEGLRPRPGTAEAARYPQISVDATARKYDRRGRVIAPASFDNLEPL